MVEYLSIMKKQQPQLKRLPSNSSALLRASGPWEVRLTPLNKVFVLNTSNEQTLWPFLDKRSVVQFGAVNRGKAQPPEEIQKACEDLLKKQRMIRSQHHDDFVETSDQYTFN